MKKIIITGNVGRDPEMKISQNGEEFVTFSLGVSVGTKDKPKTDWVDISCNGKLVDIVRNYVRKGTKLLIDGYPTVNAYMNKENKPVGVLKVFAHNLELCGSNPNNLSSSNTQDTYVLPDVPHETPTGALNSDNIPF